MAFVCNKGMRVSTVCGTVIGRFGRAINGRVGVAMGTIPGSKDLSDILTRRLPDGDNPSIMTLSSRCFGGCAVCLRSLASRVSASILSNFCPRLTDHCRCGVSAAASGDASPLCNMPTFGSAAMLCCGGATLRTINIVYVDIPTSRLSTFGNNTTSLGKGAGTSCNVAIAIPRGNCCHDRGPFMPTRKRASNTS